MGERDGPIDAGQPVGLQLDSYYLDYFGSKVHFGGHVVAMYGYDEHDVYMVDTDQQGGVVSTSLTSLAQARAARGPMTAKHRSFTLTAPKNLLSPHQDQIIAAITACADAFLNPPIANLGHRGIEKTSKLVRTWLQRTDNPQRDLPQAAQQHLLDSRRAVSNRLPLLIRSDKQSVSEPCTVLQILHR